MGDTTTTVGAVRRAVAACALATIAATGATPSHAGGPLTDFTWDAPAGGAFEFPPNWEPFDIFPPGTVIGPPTVGEMATFALGNATYTVTFGINPTNTRLRIGDDHVTFNLNGHTYTLTSTTNTSIVLGGVGLFDSAMLTLTNGTILGEDAAISPSEFGVTAQLVVGSGAVLDLDGALSIGKLDDGSLTIMSGGIVGCGTAVIGELLGTSGPGSGSATITGSGSTWDVSSALTIGDNGDGTVTISDNAFMKTGGSTSLGVKPGVSGAITVGGSLSVWNASSDIYLGGSLGGPGGTGSLTINLGGVVNVVSSPFFPIIHVRPGSSLNLNGGALTTQLDMQGGTLNWPTGVLLLKNAQTVVPGPIFASPLALDDSATVLSLFSLVVNDNGAIDLTNGAGLSGEGDLILNDGALRVSTGAHVSWTYAAFIGELAGTTGTITLDGLGASWTHGAPISQELNIGHGGSGAVSVTGGASYAIEGQCVPTLGRTDGSSGSLLISGAGSQCSVEIHPLYVGSAGDGVVTVEDGATLSGQVIILGEIDGDGEMSVDGADSSVTSGSTTVGDFGSGSLAVTGGAQLGGDCVIAQGKGSSGTALLGGRGTQLAADGFNDYIIVGGAGSGSLDVVDGASAHAGEVIIGDGSTGTGTLTLSGAGSQLVADEEIDIGFNGAGTLIVGSGALASSPLIFINEFSTLAGAGTVTGDVSSGGTIAPGLSAGTLSIDGSCALESSSALKIELAGTRAGAHDVLAVTGAVQLDGGLEVSLIDGFVPRPGDEFTIITSARGAISGTFARVVAPRGIEVIYGATSVVLAMAGAACPADLDDDGDVDGADLATLLGGWGGSESDLSGDGTVGGADLAILLGAWGSC